MTSSEFARSEAAPEISEARPGAVPSRLVLRTSCVILLLAAVLPVLAMRVLPLIDYPDHLGRMYALLHLPGDPLLARYYLLHWAMIPNLAMDLVVPPLARLTDIFFASKVFVLLLMVLMLSGPFAVQAALWRRVSAWPLVSFLFIYNWIFMYGFTNFLFGVGVALWAIAAWIRLREARPALRFAVSLGFSLVLFITHLHALGLYGLTVLCYEIWRWRENPGARGRRFFIDLIFFAAPFLLTLALLGLSKTAGNAAVTEWLFYTKIEALYFAIKNFWPALDLAIGAGFLAAVVWFYWRGRLTVHPAAWYVLAGSIVVFVAMPFRVFGSSFADSRLPIAMLFILIGMVRWEPAARASTLRFCTVVGLAALARFAVVALVWSRFADVYADFERSFQAIEPGSKILTTRMAEKGMRRTYADLLIHIPTLAMAERSSLETLAFTDPGAQVLVTRPEYRGITTYAGLPPIIDYVVRGEIDPDVTPPPLNAGYYLHWRDSYDYVYVLYARPGTAPPAKDLVLAYQGKEFQLYKVERSGAASLDSR
jgi:hypothetical protein